MQDRRSLLANAAVAFDPRSSLSKYTSRLPGSNPVLSSPILLSPDVALAGAVIAICSDGGCGNHDPDSSAILRNALLEQNGGAILVPVDRASEAY